MIARPAGGLPGAESAPAASGARWLNAGRALLAVALVSSPLAFGSVQTWAWSALAIATAAALLCWTFGSARREHWALFWSPLYVPALLFLTLGGIQQLGRFSIDPIATREALVKLSTDFLIFFLAAQFLTTAPRGAVRNFGLLATVFAFGLSVFSILQFSSSQGLLYWSVKADGWTFGPYVNHNHYAGLMEMLIPLSMAYLLSRPADHPRRAMLGFAASMPIVSLLLSGSRGGTLSLLAEVLIFAAVLWRRGTRPSWRKPTLAGPLVVVTAALLFFWLDPGDVAGRLTTVVKLGRSSEIGMKQRQAVAFDSLRMLKDHPWAGAGLGSFETGYPEYQSFSTEFLWEHAHNDYAEALAETGLVGGLLILAGLAFLLRLSFLGLAERIRHEAGQIQFGAALGCCGLLVHSAFDFNLHVPANAAWFAACAAVATSWTGELRNRTPILSRQDERLLARDASERPGAGLNR